MTKSNNNVAMSSPQTLLYKYLSELTVPRLFFFQRKKTLLNVEINNILKLYNNILCFYETQRYCDTGQWLATSVWPFFDEWWLIDVDRHVSPSSVPSPPAPMTFLMLCGVIGPTAQGWWHDRRPALGGTRQLAMIHHCIRLFVTLE